MITYTIYLLTRFTKTISAILRAFFLKKIFPEMTFKDFTKYEQNGK